jgi:hypothetical protein
LLPWWSLGRALSAQKRLHGLSPNDELVLTTPS